MCATCANFRRRVLVQDQTRSREGSSTFRYRQRVVPTTSALQWSFESQRRLAAFRPKLRLPLGDFCVPLAAPLGDVEISLGELDVSLGKLCVPLAAPLGDVDISLGELDVSLGK